MTDALAGMGNIMGENLSEDVPVVYANTFDAQQTDEPWESDTETVFEIESDGNENYSNEIEVFLL